MVLNNWTEPQRTLLRQTAESDPDVKYLCMSEEVAPTTGTPHLQMYVELSNGKSGTRVKTLFQIPQICLFTVTGSGTSNVLYVKKARPQDSAPSANFWSYGEVGNKRQGKRTDLDLVQEALHDGLNEREIAEQHFKCWVKYGNRLKIYRKLVLSPPKQLRFSVDDYPEEWRRFLPFDWKTSLVLVGATNIGKTSFAKAILGPTALLVSHIDDLLSYDPYENAGLIFDDMQFTHIPETAQIHITDIDEDRSIHCRFFNATIPANTKKIFTCNP